MFCIHHDDLDGLAAARVVAEFEKNFDLDRFFKANYTAELPYDKIEKDEKVYIVDYSFSEPQINKLYKLLDITKNIIWIDHHKSSIEAIINHPDLKEIPGLIKDGISGAALTYMYLHNVEYDDIPLYLKYVSDYDCWIYKYGSSTEYFSCYMNSVDIGITSLIWDLISNEKYFNDIVLREGAAIRRYMTNIYKDIRESYAYEVDVEGHKALVINGNGNSWLFGEAIDKYDLCIRWNYNGERYIYTIFSHSNVDASKIAVKYGGGGHKAAAGYSSVEKIW